MKRSAEVEEFLERQTKREIDTAVANTCKKLLLEAGIRRAGQKIRVNKGRHAGFEGVIETIDWPEAEVRCKGNPRWFSLWHDSDYFTVLNPSDALPPKAALFEKIGQPDGARGLLQALRKVNEG